MQSLFDFIGFIVTDFEGLSHAMDEGSKGFGGEKRANICCAVKALNEYVEGTGSEGEAKGYGGGRMSGGENSEERVDRNKVLYAWKCRGAEDSIGQAVLP